MTFDLDLSIDPEAGFIQGTGSDDFGNFEIQGFISDNFMCTFIKLYKGQTKPVHYRGLLNS